MQNNHPHLVTIQPIYAKLIFGVGLACMVVAGFFLIEGLSQFAGSNETRNVLIIGGILFQITESLCFIAAASLTFHSLTWRVTLFSLGVILFIFSIGVMTLAQKTALQTGINEASAIDEKRNHIRSQIVSLDRMIESYRFNAEKQSKSIFKDSRALGQDSINRAAGIEQKKLELSDQLFTLNQSRRETSVDFFNRLEEVTHLPAQSTEFYFLVLRSLLIELSGILLMAFGASLHALGRFTKEPERPTPTDLANGSGASLPIFNFGKDLLSKRKQTNVKQVDEQTEMQLKREQLIQSSEIQTTDTEDEDVDYIIDEHVDENSDYDNAAEDQSIQESGQNIVSFDKHNYSKYIERLKNKDGASATAKDVPNNANDQIKDDEIREIAARVFDLYKQGNIASLSRDNIIKALRSQANIKIGSNKATEIKKYIDSNYNKA
ncbi:MAG: hypothetical protein ACC707_07175 [Thiohalomonadales bacterium]